jgi:rfaE bifunctional protein nucleotidyltransferase chain/domain
MSQEKHISFKDAPAHFEALRQAGRRIVHCHGTFDLLHPGHIYHLEEAKTLGDMLVVTITADAQVNKGPGRPYFDEQHRLKALAALACVDRVVVVPFEAAVEAIECVRGDVYCKGHEYEDPTNDVTGNIADDVATVERLGGEVRYVGSVVFSSSRLINRHLDAVPSDVKDVCRSLSESVSAAGIRDLVESFRDLKVLVVGDLIFDRYTTVKVQGLTSKNRMLSGRFLEEETQPGGALAVYRHVREFAPNVRLAGLAGGEPWLAEQLRACLEPAHDFVVRSSHFTTVIKQRFVEAPKEGKEMSKLFSVNFLDGGPPDAATSAALAGKLEESLAWADVVLVADFGHGVWEGSVPEAVQSGARFLAVNCQTNSYNHGFNLLNRRFRRADSFSLDHMEMMLASGKKQFDHAEELALLRSALGARFGWITRGDIKTLGMNDRGDICQCPPLEARVVDTIGAGDAFYSLVSLGAARGADLAAITFLGQLAGAQAVRVVGNRESVSKKALLRSAVSLLSF